MPPKPTPGTVGAALARRLRQEHDLPVVHIEDEQLYNLIQDHAKWGHDELSIRYRGEHCSCFVLHCNQCGRDLLEFTG